MRRLRAAPAEVSRTTETEPRPIMNNEIGNANNAEGIGRRGLME